ncbi:tyrosine-type recombinase/integrase [Nocardiopsis tropica]|uniref:Tyrosine-type recombinase/integrase n=1 Tax=Streptomonospora nanhaiensis TaxID=1323731 RepID=A0ABY6YX71_9ACTN|nr:tyrosine-type recombinase/integrase [Streptomonospora nanhaiensis]MEE2042567.1 tyrosine-type recombinase/integrase [Nocardiopsis tropica]WAE76586.1 tyrosine-type recombinase/integrase [Streptomonospora nanhaiensis]
MLKSALEHAVREGEIPRNVARTGTPRPRRFEPLTADEARQCLTVVRNHWLHALFELALRTELRKGELLGLRWEDLDLTGGTATIHCSLQRTRSQGLTVLNAKTLASERRIVLPTECINSLEIHQERQAGRTTDSSSPPRRAGRSTPPTSPAASTAQNSGRSASTTSDTRPPPCSWNRASTSSSSRNFSATPT